MSYRDVLIPQLEIDEGRKSKPYDDGLGNVTIGVGRNLTGVGLRPAEIDLLRDNDIDEAEAEARKLFANFDSLSERRQAALVDMAFNLEHRLEGFHDFAAAVNAERWADAKAAMLDSIWAGQVHDRADRLAAWILEG